jgi:hypothetical protein
MNSKYNNQLRYIIVSIIVLIVGLIFGRAFGSHSPVDCKVPRVDSFYISKDLQVTETSLCAGLDEKGNPINLSNGVNSTEWKKIHVCAFVTTTAPSTLHVRWYSDGTKFAGSNVFKHIFQNGYVAFSLEESISCIGEWVSKPNFLEDELEAGYIPGGQYRVDIYESRIMVGSLAFYVEN